MEKKIVDYRPWKPRGERTFLKDLVDKTIIIKNITFHKAGEDNCWSDSVTIECDVDGEPRYFKTSSIAIMKIAESLKSQLSDNYIRAKVIIAYCPYGDYYSLDAPD
ncbi:MAG: hypothetical protein QW420_06160 [Candidatus Caldarchaeum sp.]